MSGDAGDQALVGALLEAGVDPGVLIAVGERRPVRARVRRWLGLPDLPEDVEDVEDAPAVAVPVVAPDAARLDAAVRAAERLTGLLGAEGRAPVVEAFREALAACETAIQVADGHRREVEAARRALDAFRDVADPVVVEARARGIAAGYGGHASPAALVAALGAVLAGRGVDFGPWRGAVEAAPAPVRPAPARLSAFARELLDGWRRRALGDVARSAGFAAKWRAEGASALAEIAAVHGEQGARAAREIEAELTAATGPRRIQSFDLKGTTNR